MEETRRNVLVGLFVLFGLAALGALIVLFGHAPQWLVPGDTYALTIDFDRVAGVRSGTLVEVNGKRIGHVREVRFADPDDLKSGVVVDVAIQKDYRIPVGSYAETVEAGLFGGGRPPIIIRPGDPALGYLAPDSAAMTGRTIGALNAVFPEEIVANLNRTSRSIGDAAEALQPVLENLDEILKPRHPDAVDAPGGLPGNLASAASRLDELLAHMNAVLGDPAQQSAIKQAVANVQTMSEDGQIVMRNLKAASEEARSVVTRTSEVVDKVDGAVDNLNVRVNAVAQAATNTLGAAGEVLDYLKVSAGRLAQGEGTVGKLLTDERLYESLVLTVERIGKTIDEIRVLVQKWQEGQIRVAF